MINVKTIVLVMMENRSFDHLLGWMSLGPYGRRTDVDGLTGDIDVASRELTNLTYDNYGQKQRWRPYLLDRDIQLATDIPHSRSEIRQQMAFSTTIGDFAMNGFAQAYFDANPGQRNGRPESLGIFPPDLVPMTAFLARNYLVCDRWFSPIPTDTQPNRIMSLAGYTRVDYTASFIPDHDLVIDWCGRKGVRWRAYSSGFPFLALMRTARALIDGDHFRTFGQLARDVQTEPDSEFPQFIIVEPEYGDDPLARHPNDNHPPLPMGGGEAFLSDVYRALISNPARWAETLLIVVYDEHGGLFDHVPPFTVTTRPPKDQGWRDATPFTTSGLRVPAILVSPWVQRGGASHLLLDHTSILRFLADTFDGGAPYSDEVAARHREAPLNSVGALLSATPQVGIPAPPDLGHVNTVTFASPRVAATESMRAFQQARKELQAEAPGSLAVVHAESLFHLPVTPLGSDELAIGSSAPEPSVPALTAAAVRKVPAKPRKRTKGTGRKARTARK